MTIFIFPWTPFTEPVQPITCSLFLCTVGELSKHEFSTLFHYHLPHFPLNPFNGLLCWLNPHCFFVQFDALVAALPLAEGGEEAQMKRIAELQVQCYFLVGPSHLEFQHEPLLFFLVFFCLSCQAENDAVGQELQRQLEAAGNFLNLSSLWMLSACHYDLMKDGKEKSIPPAYFWWKCGCTNK